MPLPTTTNRESHVTGRMSHLPYDYIGEWEPISVSETDKRVNAKMQVASSFKELNMEKGEYTRSVTS